MDVLALLFSYPPVRLTGAALATAAILEGLQRRGLRVLVLSTDCPPEGGGYRWQGVPVQPLTSEAARAAGAAGPPPLVVTHATDDVRMVGPAEELAARGAPQMIVVHSAEAHVVRALSRRMVPDLVVPNCWTTARALNLAAGGPQVLVVRPALKMAPGSLPWAREGHVAPVVGFVNAARVKGGDIIAGLIERSRGRWEWLGAPGGYAEKSVPEAARAVQREGQIMPWEMSRFYSQIDVLVGPSWTESYGLANLEALAAGRPVVVSNLPGVREALAGAPEGWVRWCSPGSVGGFEDQLARTLAAPPPSTADRIALEEFLRRTIVAGELDRIYLEDAVLKLLA